MAIKKQKKRLVKEISFTMKDGQSLVVSYTLLGDGLETVCVHVKNGKAEVRAHGHTRFEFSDTKDDSGQCDFWLSNANANITIQDILLGKFWGQFTWGKLFRYKKDKALARKLKKLAKKLVDEFEEKAAAEMNALIKK